MANPDGVPTLADPDITFEQPDLDSIDEQSLPTDLILAPQWGIFDQDGNAVIVGDSTLAFEFNQDAEVLNFPTEQGGFASYNKVQTPFRLKFTFTKGGTQQDREQFLGTIDEVIDSLYLYVGTTPERAYPSITVDHYDLRRTARGGVTLLTVDVWCQEVRSAQAAQFSSSSGQVASAGTSTTTSTSDVPPSVPIVSAQDLEANDPVNLGLIQPQPLPQISVASAAAGSGTLGDVNTSIATITARGVSLTNSLGNVIPPAIASAVHSVITFGTSSLRTLTGIVSGQTTGSVGQITGYGLQSGSSVPINEVKNILPPGFTVVQ